MPHEQKSGTTIPTCQYGHQSTLNQQVQIRALALMAIPQNLNHWFGSRLFI